MEKSLSGENNNGEDEINENGNSASKMKETQDDGSETELSKEIYMQTKLVNFADLVYFSTFYNPFYPNFAIKTHCKILLLTFIFHLCLSAQPTTQRWLRLFLCHKSPFFAKILSYCEGFSVCCEDRPYAPVQH